MYELIYLILGQQGNDTIYGDAGQDDLIGGHNILYAAASGLLSDVEAVKYQVLEIEGGDHGGCDHDG